MPDTDWLDDHIELYAADALPADEHARVERELSELPTVALRIYEARIAETRSAVTTFASGYAQDAPDDLRDRVLRRVFDGDEDQPRATSSTPPPSTSPSSAPPPVDEATAPSSAPSGPVPPTHLPTERARRRPRRVAAAAVAAALVAVIALAAGVLIGRGTVTPEKSPTPPVAVDESDRQVLDVLRAPDARVSVARLQDDRGTMSVVTSRSGNRAVALLRDLRNPIPDDRTFQLWLVGKSAQPTSAGLIARTGGEPPVVVDRLDSSRVLAVTVEPRGGSPQPTTPILAQITL